MDKRFVQDRGGACRYDRGMHGILRIAYAPVFFTGLLTAAVILSAGGTRPLPLAGLLVAAILVSALVERVIPYDPRFNASHGDRGRDLAHAVVNEAANTGSVLAMPLVVALAPAYGGWPRAWPVALQLALRHPTLVNKLVSLSARYRMDGWFASVLEGFERLSATAFAGTGVEKAFKEHTPDATAFDAYLD